MKLHGGWHPRWDRLVQEEQLFSLKTFWESIKTSKITLVAADMTTSETKFKEVKSQLLYFKSEDWDCCSIIHFPPFLICPVRQSRECNLCSSEIQTAEESICTSCALHGKATKVNVTDKGYLASSRLGWFGVRIASLSCNSCSYWHSTIGSWKLKKACLHKGSSQSCTGHIVKK